MLIKLTAIVSLLMLMFLGYSLSVTTKSPQVPRLSREEIYKKRMVIGCSPDWTILDADSIAETMTPLPGWGSYRWKIASRSDSARYYFNQGINMYYAFHIIESLASFKKAEHFDKNDPMIYWGQALAYGPNINDFAYAAAPDAFAAAEKAVQLSASATAKEKALINAMAVRYSNDSTISRTVLNQRYGDSMKLAYQRFSNDADMGALYADAIMIQHPWEYWKHNGEPQAWTPELVSVLEKVLRVNPTHPGANHYYIHSVEASPNPGRALPSADRLGKMMPGVSHMVHMPSHIYIRTGNYQRGIVVNDMALKGFDKYLAIYPAVANNAFLYQIHNAQMKAACAMMKPNYSAAIKASEECAATIDSSMLNLPQPVGNAAQYVFMTPIVTNARYGKWNEVLAEPAVPPSQVFGSAIQHWARGMAYANIEKIAEAKSELALLEEVMKHPDMQVRMEPINKPVDQMTAGLNLLQGTIKLKSGNLSAAIASFKEAVQAEDALIYTEPRDWLIPTRHYLANALIKSADYKEAKKVLLEDLKINPHNFYALWAMEEIAIKEHDFKSQAKYHSLWKAVYKNSDLPYPSLVY